MTFLMAEINLPPSVIANMPPKRSPPVMDLTMGLLRLRLMKVLNTLLITASPSVIENTQRRDLIMNIMTARHPHLTVVLKILGRIVFIVAIMMAPRLLVTTRQMDRMTVIVANLAISMIRALLIVGLIMVQSTA